MRQRVQTSLDDSTAHPSAPDRIWHYIAYYGMSEIAQRATRLATTVMLARLLLPIELGLAAAAITCFEMVRAIANAGIGQAVIRATDAQLAATCLTAHRLVWIICVGLAVVQTGIGAIVAAWTGHAELLPLIAALAGVYLMMPQALIQTYLIQRRNGHATIAKVATVQAVADNILTIALALGGCGAWSIVLPKLVTCPIWTLGMRRAQHWTPDASVTPAPSRGLLLFSLPVLGAETLTAARLQLDKVLVGAMLGVEALGIYYFVFNAGIGLSLSLTSALSNALYPHFAAAAGAPHELLRRLDRSLWQKALPIAAVILGQAAAAPVYVPLLFGAKWQQSAWMVGVLCASAAAKVFADAAAQALRAAGRTGMELKGTLAMTCISLAGLALGLTQDLATAVVILAYYSGVSQIAFAAIARRQIALAAPPQALDLAAGLTVTHLLDDTALGGVTRFLDALAITLDPRTRQNRVGTNPRRLLPPRLDADVVVVHFTMSWSKLPYLLALRARRGRRPIIIVEHSYTGAFESVYVLTPTRFRMMLRMSYSLVEQVVAVSYGQAAWMRSKRLLPAGKLCVISPFTDCASLADLPLPAPHSGPLRLGAYGRYCAQKDFATLIAAMKRIDPSTATLQLRGFGPDAAALKALAADLPHVSVGEKIDDLAAFLGTTDAVVVPSCFEPFGQVALEARLAARPVIVTDVDGLPEQVEPTTGLIVRPGDAAGLAAAIVELAAQHRSGAWLVKCTAARVSAVDHSAISTRRWERLLAQMRATPAPNTMPMTTRRHSHLKNVPQF